MYDLATKLALKASIQIILSMPDKDGYAEFERVAGTRDVKIIIQRSVSLYVGYEAGTEICVMAAEKQGVDPDGNPEWMISCVERFSVARMGDAIDAFLKRSLYNEAFKESGWGMTYDQVFNKV